jgi:hypothetical protein
VLADDRLDQRVLNAQRLQLQEQTLGQVERRDPRRVEGAHQSDGRLHVFVVLVTARADLFARDAEVAVFVDVADQVRRDLPYLRVRLRHRKLPGEVLGKTLGPRQDVLERELLGLLLVLPRVVRRVEVVFEVGREVDLLERVLFLLGGSGRLGSRRSFFGLAGGLGGLGRLLLLLEDGILHDFLGEDLLEFEAGHLQQLDGLLQRRRHDQPLRESEVELLFQGHTNVRTSQ